MAWCYTFGISVGEGECKDPMLVVEGEDRCACDACETSCRGKFPGCHALVFAPGGRELQLKALPQDLIPHQHDEPVHSHRAANGSATTTSPTMAPLDVAESPTPPVALGDVLRRLDELEERLAHLESRPEPGPSDAQTGRRRWFAYPGEGGV